MINVLVVGGGIGFLHTDLRELVVVEEAIMYPDAASPAERSYPADRHTLRGVLLDGLGTVVQYGKVFDLAATQRRHPGLAARTARPGHEPHPAGRAVLHVHLDIRTSTAGRGQLPAVRVRRPKRPVPAPPERLNGTRPVTVLGDAVHAMPPAGDNGANIALRDAALLTRQLSQAAQDQLPLLDAIGNYEAEMRTYGFQAVDLAMKTLRQGLASNPVNVFFSHSWFRLCNIATPLRRMTFANSWAKISEPRQWEQPAATPTHQP